MSGYSLIDAHCQLDIIYHKEKTLRCCSFIDDEWLIGDYQASRLLHISKNGIIKTIVPYEETPWFVNLFGSNILAISTKNQGLNLHAV